MKRQKRKSKKRSKRRSKKLNSDVIKILSVVTASYLGYKWYEHLTNQKDTQKDAHKQITVFRLIGYDGVQNHVKFSLEKLRKDIPFDFEIETTTFHRNYKNEISVQPNKNVIILICVKYSNGVGFRVWDYISTYSKKEKNKYDEAVRLGDFSSWTGFNKEIAFAELQNRPYIVVYCSDSNVNVSNDEKKTLINFMKSLDLTPPIEQIQYHLDKPQGFVDYESIVKCVSEQKTVAKKVDDTELRYFLNGPD